MWHLHLLRGTFLSSCFIDLFKLIYGSWTHILWPTDSGAKPPGFSPPGGATLILPGSRFLTREMRVILVFAATSCSEGQACNALSTGWRTGRAFCFCWRKHLEVSGMASISSDQTEGRFTKFLTPCHCARAAATKHQGQGSRNERNLRSHSPDAGSSRYRFGVPPRPLSLCPHESSALCTHIPGGSLSVLIPSSYQSTGLGPPSEPHLNLITLSKVSSPNRIGFPRYWG